jgi:hypothetical protein
LSSADQDCQNLSWWFYKNNLSPDENYLSFSWRSHSFVFTDGTSNSFFKDDLNVVKEALPDVDEQKADQR